MHLIRKVYNSPMTSESCVDDINQASSPNRPNFGLDRWKSLGKPHATDTKCGFTLLFVSTNVEKPLRNARVTSRVVQQIDCILSSFSSSFNWFIFLVVIFFFRECVVSLLRLPRFQFGFIQLMFSTWYARYVYLFCCFFRLLLFLLSYPQICWLRTIKWNI